MTSAPSGSGSKSISSPGSNFSNNPPAFSGTGSTGFDWGTSRRSVVPGPRNNATLPSAVASSTPRKGQGARKQHRQTRRALDRDTVLEEIDPDMVMTEAATARSNGAGRRRQQTSITHLLDYATSTRQYLENSYGRNSYRSRRQPTWGPGSGYHPIDKARFVHANYRFIVSPTGNYATHATDADKHIDWNDVQQIIASTESQSTSCPICLSDPVAPRMAKCGHIFCLPCLLRFVHSTATEEESAPRKEARWKKCPICEDSFKIAETRPVRFYAGQESPMPRPGEDVVLRLMVRESGSITALPKEGGVDVVNMGEDIPWHFAANVLDYARIMKGTNEYMAGQHDEEMEQLRRQGEEDENMFGQEEGEWMQRAIRAITTVRDRLLHPELREEGGEGGGTIHPDPVVLLHPPGKALGKRASGPTFHFYTSPPHLYLSPLDIRILKTKFGDFSNFPTTLLPSVEHISTGHTVDDALRKRARYLGHLPVGCVVNFLECDWTDIVPDEILDTFKEQLEKRRKEHHDKAAQEDREKMQAERIEAAAMGRGVRRHFDLGHGHDGSSGLSVVNDEDFVPLAPALGRTPPGERVGFDSLAGLSTSPSETRTIWGTRAIAGAAGADPTMPATQDTDDGWLREDEVFGTGLELQMEGLGLESAGGGGSKKKKKKQKITLMSTGGRRGV